MNDIHELYTQSGRLHGHYCPGLAIGVRAGYEALLALGLEDNSCKYLSCIYENSACYLDGIQVLTGCTPGKKNLISRPTGKTAFSFFRTDTEEKIRLYFLNPEFEGSKEEKIEYILTAPLEKVFSIGIPVYALPETKPREPEIKCSRCGESVSISFITDVNGNPVCPDCL